MTISQSSTMDNNDQKTSNHPHYTNANVNSAGTFDSGNNVRRRSRSWIGIQIQNLYLMSFIIVIGVFNTINNISNDENTSRMNSDLNMEKTNTLNMSEKDTIIGTDTDIQTDTKMWSILRRSYRDDMQRQPHNIDTKTIRRWGCSRNETPFIFIHIGKAGGGEARRMFAAAAIDYTTPPEWRSFHVEQEKAFYPVHTNGLLDGSAASTSTVAKARFASSQHKQFLPLEAFLRTSSFEGNRECSAETPIGQAVQCPANITSRCPKDDNVDPTSSLASCHLVYTGHNMLGNEMHWLPSGYLSRWWESIVGGSSNFGSLRGDRNLLWKDIPDWSHCGEYDQKQKEPVTRKTALCRKRLTREVDLLAKRGFPSLLKRVENTIGERNKKNITVLSWSPVYASLPVLRITMTREPFSWLASKYQWHNLNTTFNLTYDNIEEMTRPSDAIVFADAVRNDTSGPGWVNHFALKYIMMLCGEDCLVRYIYKSATLEDIVRQAEENLRHSFAVVGLLTEARSFYKMVVARVAYMANLTRNEHMMMDGGRHHTLQNSEVKTLYKDPEFQRQIIEASPEVAALVKLYEVSVEVNQYQLEELKSCPSWDPIQY